MIEFEFNFKLASYESIAMTLIVFTSWLVITNYLNDFRSRMFEPVLSTNSKQIYVSFQGSTAAFHTLDDVIMTFKTFLATLGVR